VRVCIIMLVYLRAVSVSTCLSTGISVFRVKDARKPIKGNIL